VELERLGREKLPAGNILVRFDENCTIALAHGNQLLLTICRQDPNQLFKGVFQCRESAAGLTPGAATKGDWHARIAD
jgi:hypothetical protein